MARLADDSGQSIACIERESRLSMFSGSVASLAGKSGVVHRSCGNLLAICVPAAAAPGDVSSNLVAFFGCHRTDDKIADLLGRRA